MSITKKKDNKKSGIRRQSYLQVMMRNKMTIIGLVLIVILVFASIFANLLSGYSPSDTDPSNQLLGPGVKHLFGTDNFGRDIFTRVVYGGRITLLLGILSVAFSFIVGVFLGGIAGYGNKGLSMVIMRFMDMLAAFPQLLLAITIATVMGRGAMSSIIATGIIGIPDFARLMYSQTLSIKERGYVESGIAIGLTRRQILFRHIFPNCLSSLVVRATLGLGSTILLVASLSFLGLGVQPPTPEWGALISDGRSYIVSGQWWIVGCPGFAIMMAVIGFNLFGDGLRDILDPRSRTSI